MNSNWSIPNFSCFGDKACCCFRGWRNWIDTDYAPAPSQRKWHFLCIKGRWRDLCLVCRILCIMHLLMCTYGWALAHVKYIPESSSAWSCWTGNLDSPTFWWSRRQVAPSAHCLAPPPENVRRLLHPVLLLCHIYLLQLWKKYLMPGCRALLGNMSFYVSILVSCSRWPQFSSSPWGYN